MRRKRRFFIPAIVALTVLAAVWAAGFAVRPDLSSAVPVARPPRISPDYSGTVIPPNIAPLNFAVRENGRRFFVRIGSEVGPAIEIFGGAAQIRIPPRRWRSLLEANCGKPLRLDVYAEEDGQWRQYRSITNVIAQDTIDSHIAYRLIRPLYSEYRHTAVYQRDLTTYRESVVLDVIDAEAGLAYYHVEAGIAKMVPRASDEQRLESYPAWSPDGRYLYYCSAPNPWKDGKAELPVGYEEVRYDLMRIPYDIDADQWGDPETVLSSRKTGLSVLMPRISPDGRFLLFCMCPHGSFPAFCPGSDLYMMDVATGDYRKLDINSESSESWHCWSSNGRWIAFSSKRLASPFTRCYLSFVDETGRAHKPLVLPQRDPEFYDSFLMTVSVPELITGPVPVSSEALSRAARSPTP
jgi:hypothetical protein